MATQRTTRRNIMVIDDSKVICRIIEGILAREGYRVASFAHGPEAMQALTKRQTPPPDLVLLDIHLPHMDGYNVAKLFRQNRAFDQTVIVMLSGSDGIMDKLHGRLVGAKGHIAKPFKPGEVLSIVQNLLNNSDH